MEEEKKQVTIDDFVINEKVDAFTRYYRPASASDLHVTEFDEVRLRCYFKAYSMPLGDPLVVYVSALAAKGFRMETSLVFGEPVIRVTEKYDNE